MTMALDGNTRMVVDQVFYDPTANQGTALFSLVEGAFLMLSGEIAKLGEDVVQIQTPTGVIGIRGTNLAASHIGITQVVLLPNPDGTVSALIFFNDGGFVILDEAFEGLRSIGFDVTPSQPTIFASLEAAFASLGISPRPPAPSTRPSHRPWRKRRRRWNKAWRPRRARRPATPATPTRWIRVLSPLSRLPRFSSSSPQKAAAARKMSAAAAAVR